MLKELQVEIVRTTHKDRRIELRLIEELKQKMGLHGERAQTLAVTFDRVIAACSPESRSTAGGCPVCNPASLAPPWAYSSARNLPLCKYRMGCQAYGRVSRLRSNRAGFFMIFRWIMGRFDKPAIDIQEQLELLK